MRKRKCLRRGQYNKLRNQVTSRSRKEGKLSFQNRVKESGNPSEKWKIIKEMDPPDNQDQFKLKEKYLYCHQSYTLSDKKPFTCTSCGQKFDNPSELNQHQSEHQDESLFNCSQCDKKFTNQTNLNNHQNDHEKPFSCSQREETFECSSEPNKHKSKDQPDEKPFTCSTCGKNFAKSCDLNNHESEHQAETFLICSQCDKKFTTVNELKSHQSEHPFRCSQCDKAFECLEELNSHESEQPNCPACEKKFEKLACSKCDNNKS